MSVRIGQTAPGLDLALKAYDRTKDGTDKQFQDLKLADFKGKWVCLYFYPLDFTFVCPTEIVAFDKALGEFKDRETIVLTGSTDSVYSHKGWCDSHNELGQLKHLMIGDTSHELSKAYDVLDAAQGIAYRGVYLIDPVGVLRWLAVHDPGVGRNVDDKLCPCNWKPGQSTLN